MKLTYEILLMVVLSTTPGHHELIFYEYPTWEECRARETIMRAELKKTRNPETVTVSCRRDVEISVGSPATLTTRDAN